MDQPCTTTSSFPDSGFLAFATECRRLALVGGSVSRLQSGIAALMREFIATWEMPDPRFRECRDDAPYASYLLFLCPRTELCIVLDVFDVGQVAAIHNHGIWGVFGCLSGTEIERRFSVIQGASEPRLDSQDLLMPGHVRQTDESGAAFHQVECASKTASRSLHVYGADIGRAVRHRWDPDRKALVEFCSGYSNDSSNDSPYLPAHQLPTE